MKIAEFLETPIGRFFEGCLSDRLLDVSSVQGRVDAEWNRLNTEQKAALAKFIGTMKEQDC